MNTYTFTDTSSLYEQLYNKVRSDIISGALPEGSKLPSKRSLASNLGLSTITVENAYLQLMAEGYITSRPRSGYYVSASGIIASGSNTFAIKEKEPSYYSEDEDISEPKFLADFVSNQTLPERFPFSTWTKLMRETMMQNTEILMRRSPGRGLFGLREAIAEHASQKMGLRVHPSHIVIGAGTEYLYSLLIQLLGRDKVYGVVDPGYSKTTQVYTSNEVKCVHLTMDEAGISMDSLMASNADVLHISPSHHFPTGQITHITRRHELLNWLAESENRYIIEDEYDSEFRLQGKPIPPLSTINNNGRVIYMNTFSKSLSSTIRISYMILPEELSKSFDQKLSFYSCTVANFEQLTLAQFLKRGYFEKHLNRMRNYYRNTRNLLLSEIKKSPLAAAGNVLEADSGLHFLFKLGNGISASDAAAALGEKGIRIAALSDYYYSNAPKSNDTLIINYSGIRQECIPETVAIMSQVISQL